MGAGEEYGGERGEVSPPSVTHAPHTLARLPCRLYREEGEGERERSHISKVSPLFILVLKNMENIKENKLTFFLIYITNCYLACYLV